MFHSALFSRVALLLLAFVPVSNSKALISPSEEQVVNRLREYLRIDTAQPYPNYGPVATFLVKQGEQIGLEIKVIELVEKKPVVLFSWKGKDPSLPSVLLNSHLDVVPVDVSKWTYGPFQAHMDGEGKIFARGSQDTKSAGMQYLEAIRNLKAAGGFQPERSLHVSFVPDEEIGGRDGAEKFVGSKEFEELKVGVCLDEGLASPEDEYRVFYGERMNWWFIVKATGAPAHGSRMFDGTAVQNLREAINRIDEFRTTQFEKVKSGGAAEAAVVSVNNVFLKAGLPTPTGFVMNVQPSEAEAGFDMRLPPDVDAAAIEKKIVEEWAPASRNLSVRFLHKRDVTNKFGEPAVTVADDTNPWWVKLKAGVLKGGGNLGKPEIRMSSADARFLRYEGISAFGFSPMANTPVLLHDHNEFLPVTEYLKGIGVYEEIIKSLTGPETEDIDGSHTEL